MKTAIITSLKSNKKNVFHNAIFVALFLLFFSIPVCSFRSNLYVITWLLAGLSVLLIAIDFFFFDKVEIDIINVSLVSFSISSIISSALSGFMAFKVTAPLLSLLSAIIYTFLVTDKTYYKKMFYVCYFAVILFLIVFIFKYLDPLIHLDFTRLGDEFGDINDVCLFLSFGFVASFYFVFYAKKIYLKLLSGVLFFLFGYCSLSCGSKIFILVALIAAIILVYSFFGIKKWYISSIVIVALIGSTIALLQLPVLSSFRDRIASFIDSLFGTHLSVSAIDYSTINRNEMFRCGISLFLRKPLFGWGIWGFATFGGINNGWSHNNISESLCNFGIVGSVLFHFGIFYSIYKAIKKYDKSMILVLLINLFFVSSMLSVALNSEKIYALLIPVALSGVKEIKSFGLLNIKKMKFNRSATCE